MRRREFIAGIGSTVVWPVLARAEPPRMPVIGYVNSRSPNEAADIVNAFRLGLKETGFVDGENVTIQSRFAAGDFAQLPDLADNLVRHGVNVIVATGGTVCGRSRICQRHGGTLARKPVRNSSAAERRQQLDTLGFIWDVLEANWEDGFRHLTIFKEREGHCRVPSRHVENGFRLGGWVETQRAAATCRCLWTVGND